MKIGDFEKFGLKMEESLQVGGEVSGMDGGGSVLSYVLSFFTRYDTPIHSIAFHCFLLFPFEASIEQQAFGSSILVETGMCQPVSKRTQE